MDMKDFWIAGTSYKKCPRSGPAGSLPDLVLNMQEITSHAQFVWVSMQNLDQKYQVILYVMYYNTCCHSRRIREPYSLELVR
jgi:hypothetical protein